MSGEGAGPPVGARKRLQLPLYATGTLKMRGAGVGYPVQLANVAPSGLELLAPRDIRFPSDLRTGTDVEVTFEFDSSIVRLQARVQQATATLVRVSQQGAVQSISRRRRHKRVRLNERVAVTVVNEAGGEVDLPAVLVDISLGGCQLRFGTPVGTGQHVTFTAHFDGAVALVGTTVRRTGATSEECTVGVQFGDLDPAARAALDRLLVRGTRGMRRR